MTLVLEPKTGAAHSDPRAITQQLAFYALVTHVPEPDDRIVEPCHVFDKFDAIAEGRALPRPVSARFDDLLAPLPFEPLTANVPAPKHSTRRTIPGALIRRLFRKATS